MAKAFAAGTTDKVAVTNPFTLGAATSFTYAFWVKQRFRPSNSQGTDKGSVDLFVFSAANWFCEVPRATTNALASVSDTGVMFPTLNVWTFVAITYDETNGIKIYKGTLAAAMAEVSYAATPTVGAGNTNADSGDLFIGNRNGASALSVDHNYEHVSLWDKTLTMNHMNQLRIFPYAAPHRFVAPNGTATLKGYWPFTESANATARDHSLNANHGTVTGATVIAGAPFIVTRRGAQVIRPGGAGDILLAQASM